MIEPRDIPEAVLWHDGMLLAPQHFQQAARRSESLLAYGLAAACPYPWGISRLAVDHAALIGGLLRVEQLEAVLPDGLLVLHPSAGDQPLELDLTATGQDVRSGPRIVYLAVAGHDGPNSTGNGPRRYRSVEDAASFDEATGEEPIEIPRLVPAPVLLAGDERGRPPSRRWVSLPLVRVAFRDDRFVLDTFSGPRLRVERGTELHAVAAEIALRLREKATTLAERLQAPGTDLAAGTGWDAVQALARGLPRLEALLASERAHPFELFLTLADIVGNLTGIARRTCPPPLRAYVHDDPLLAYAQAAELIAGATAQLRDPYRTVRFERKGEGRFVLDLPAGAADRELILGVRGGPAAGPAAVGIWLDGAVIGSSSQLRAIRERRTLGAPRRIVDGVAELDLLAPRGVVLSRVGPDAAVIRPGEPLEVIGRIDEAGEAEPVEVLLFVGAAGSGAGQAP